MKNYPNRLDMIADLPSGSVGAEIGVHRGEFAAQILGLPNIDRLYLIDPWRNMPQEEWHSDLNGPDQQANLEATIAAVGSHIWTARSEILKMTSREAYESFLKFCKLNFVYIDANHSFESVLEDLTNWSKIAPIICGHDFCTSDLSRRHNWGVVEAVEEFLERNLDWHLEAVTLDDPPSFKMVRT